MAHRKFEIEITGVDCTVVVGTHVCRSTTSRGHAFYRGETTVFFFFFSINSSELEV